MQHVYGTVDVVADTEESAFIAAKALAARGMVHRLGPGCEPDRTWSGAPDGTVWRVPFVLRADAGATTPAWSWVMDYWGEAVIVAPQEYRDPLLG